MDLQLALIARNNATADDAPQRNCIQQHRFEDFPT